MIACSKVHTIYCKCLQFKLFSIYHKVLKSCSCSVVTKKIVAFRVKISLKSSRKSVDVWPIV